MHVEILFKVGNSNPANHDPVKNWQDGHPIAAMPRGLRIEPLDFNEWMVNRIDPPGFPSLPKWKRNVFRRDMRRRRAFLRPGMTTPQKIDAIRKINDLENVGPFSAWLQAQADAYNAAAREGRIDWTTTDIRDGLVAEMDLRIADKQATVDKIMVVGLDTNWGFADLEKHAVVHADLTWHQYEQITLEPTDLTEDVFRKRRAWARRAHKVAYQALLSGQSLADVQNPLVYVPADRSVALFTAAMLTTEVPEPV